MLTVSQIREKFLNFFSQKGCKILPSSGLIPNDPTLLFVNSGMVQFKNYFSGAEKPKFTRAATAQKCVRAGGKHNDLDNVGYTARHHTFFEMLGNFSFNDYFKREAITWAWEFLTEWLKIPRERLLATVYHDDFDAFDIWKNDVGLPEEKIRRIASKDNFWEMGDVGPCGPCSEIFYDHGPEIAGGVPGSPEEDGDRYVEIWNIVFTQFYRNKNGELENLPQRNIDTGMGLERVAAVMQGVHNNYDIDLFKTLIDNSKSVIGDGDIFCHRIIADHLRSSCFLIADGVSPSNEGRGYALRRIIRRAILQSHKLGCGKTLFFRLAPCLTNLMGDAYGELREKEPLIMEILKDEEDKFRETLDNGMKIIGEKLKELRSGDTFSGIDAFKMYDTYGFPPDIIHMILRKKNITLDQEGFDREMKKQKERARANWVGSGDPKTNELILKLTEPTEFEGYEKFSIQGARILNIIKNNEFVNTAKAGDDADIVLDKTCFYGESGGQVGDTGLMILLNDNHSIRLPFSFFTVGDTLKSPGNVIIHRGKIGDGEFSVGNVVNLAINEDRRKKITANHSAAHLLQYALRTIIGGAVSQKGSMVDENRLRFDVTCPRQITRNELKKVELLVNELIIQNGDVKTEVAPLEQAKKMGALALFSEKYGETVRVVFMGKNIGNDQYLEPVKKDNYELEDAALSLTKKPQGDGFLSAELCGGCHVRRTGDIGCFKILREESIAAGVRRIEAATGLKVLEYAEGKDDLIENINRLIKSDDKNLLEKINGLLKSEKDLAKKNRELEKKLLKSIQPKEIKVGELTVAGFAFENVDGGICREIAGELLGGKYKKNAVIMFQCVGDGKNKNIAIIALSEDLGSKYDARKLLEQLGIKGGGNSSLAMGQGNPLKLEELGNIL